MKIANATIALSILATAAGTAAVAQSPFEGREGYATLFLGVNQIEDVDFDYFQPFAGAVVGQGSITTDSGYNAGAILGLRFSPTLRGEVEFSYSSNDTKKLKSPAVDYDGSIDAIFGLVNLWYDVPVNGAFKPYAGGGIGFARVSQDARTSGLAEALVDDSDTAFAGQIGFGVKYKLNQRGTLDIGYRYKMTADVDFSTSQTAPRTDFTDSQYASHSLNIGYSFSF